VHLSGLAFTFIHVRISRDLSIRFILPLDRILDADNILFTYAFACDAGAANNPHGLRVKACQRRPAFAARSRTARHWRIYTVKLLILEHVPSASACIGDPASIKAMTSCHINFFLYSVGLYLAVLDDFSAYSHTYKFSLIAYAFLFRVPVFI